MLLSGYSAFTPPEWYGRYGKRAEQDRLLRKSKVEQTFFEQVGTDGISLLGAVYNGDAPEVLRDLPKVEVLRQCWLEQFYVDDGKVKLRGDEDVKPSPRRLDTPYDVDAHYGTKGKRRWLGYKVHYTESCNDDTPNLAFTSWVRADRYEGVVRLLGHRLTIRKEHSPAKVGRG